MSASRFLAPPQAQPLEPGPSPTFSVAIAAFQAEATVRDAVASALEQSRPPLEVVACDDGSTDGTAAALETFAGRITVVRQENRGEAAAKNAAVARCGGDFVAFLDADDVYLPGRLEALAALAAARPDLDVLTTNAELEVDGEIVGTYYPLVATFPVDEQAARIVANDSAIFGAAAVRRSTFLEAGGLNERLRSADDWNLWMRLVLSGSRIGLVDEPLYRYRLHDQGTSADQVRGWRDCVEALEDVLAVAAPRGEDRAAVLASLERHRGIATLTEAEAALRAGTPDRRSRSWAVARTARDPRTRGKAAFAAAFPGLAAKLLERRESRSRQSRLRKPIPGR
jgi:glycosyltransferase involved in cell wall biosynthesis